MLCITISSTSPVNRKEVGVLDCSHQPSQWTGREWVFWIVHTSWVNRKEVDVLDCSHQPSEQEGSGCFGLFCYMATTAVPVLERSVNSITMEWWLQGSCSLCRSSEGLEKMTCHCQGLKSQWTNQLRFLNVCELFRFKFFVLQFFFNEESVVNRQT